MLYLIQTWDGATIHAFSTEEGRDRKLRALRLKHPRTVYTTKEITR